MVQQQNRPLSLTNSPIIMHVMIGSNARSLVWHVATYFVLVFRDLYACFHGHSGMAPEFPMPVSSGNAFARAASPSRRMVGGDLAIPAPMRPALLGPGVAWARRGSARARKRSHRGIARPQRKPLDWWAGFDATTHPIGARSRRSLLRAAWAGGARVNGTREPGAPTTPHECLSMHAAGAWMQGLCQGPHATRETDPPPLLSSELSWLAAAFTSGASCVWAARSESWKVSPSYGRGKPISCINAILLIRQIVLCLIIPKLHPGRLEFRSRLRLTRPWLDQIAPTA